MSGAFHQAWAVLKADFLGSGAYRMVNRGDISRGQDPNLAYKRPHKPYEAMDPQPVAAGQALAQMGYPFAPETPFIDPQSNYYSTPMTTQQLASEDFTDVPIDQSVAPLQETFLQQMGMRDWTQDPKDPLLEGIGVWDVGRRNVGYYDDDGLKVIDFDINFPSREMIDSGRGWSFYANHWGKVPREKRETFTNLFADRSMFDPWQNMGDDSWKRAWKNDWGRYLQTIRNLQFFNDIYDNPAQKRLFEFDSEADPNDVEQLQNVRGEAARRQAA